MNNTKTSHAQSKRLTKRLRTLRFLGAVCGGAALYLATSGQPQLRAAETPGQPDKNQPATAQPAAVQPVPQALSELIQRIDAASSRKDLKAVLKFYSPAFTHSDGLDYQTLQQAVTAFWKDAKTLQYATKIDAWQAQGDKYLLETTTTIQGIRTAADRDANLTTVIKSKTTVDGKQIVAQDILSEQTRLSIGEKPPVVQITLPEKVNVGQTFSFDAVVKAPVGDDLLLGAAVEEPISPTRYLQPTDVVLEPLAAGGIFKMGQAPQQPTREWISAILIQEGGMTIVSQRLNVIKPNASSALPR
jgi:hypothetical protein